MASSEATATVETITPAKAKDYLANMATNRGVRRQEVLKIKEAILADRYALNAETIKFNDKGQLVDGQHRLHAVVSANKSIKSYVVRGLKNSNVLAIDSGVKRRVSDQLIIDGVVSDKFIARQLSSAISILLKWDRQDWGWQPSAVEVKDYYEVNPAILDSITKMSEYKGKLTWIRPIARVPIACHWRFSQIDSKSADEFFDHLLVGTDIDNPATILARQISRGWNEYRQSPKTEVAMFIKAWKSFLNNEQPKRYLVKRTEEFPVL